MDDGETHRLAKTARPFVFDRALRRPYCLCCGYRQACASSSRALSAFWLSILLPASGRKVKKMSHIYFGGSRHPQNINPAQVSQIVAAVVAAGHSVHVGCQFGADLAVLQNLPPRSCHRVFAVHACGSAHYPFNHHISVAYRAGHHIAFCAGGQSAPMPARYLLRSIAAFQGCDLAVFFSPGSGSLAVAREFAKTHKQIFSFSEQPPAPIAGSNGVWCQSFFEGFQCWQWGYYPQNTQPALF